MRIAFAALLFTAASAVSIANSGNERVELTTTDVVPFVSNGNIQLQNSYGGVHVEGWDQPNVEVTVRRVTHKKHAASQHPELRNRLEEVTVVTKHDAEDRLVIETHIPQGSNFKNLRGSSNLEMEYTIKAPYKTNLVIRHAMGELEVVNVTGNTEITSSTGDISLKLPKGEDYVVDAKAKTGDVTSGVSEVARVDAHKVYVRLDAGDINIQRYNP